MVLQWIYLAICGLGGFSVGYTVSVVPLFMMSRDRLERNRWLNIAPLKGSGEPFPSFGCGVIAVFLLGIPAAILKWLLGDTLSSGYGDNALPTLSVGLGLGAILRVGWKIYYLNRRRT